MRTFVNGLLTGLVIQAAIGPVFFFVIHLALQRSMYDGLVAVMAVTIADYLYMLLAVFGVGKLLERNNVKKIFETLSSIILIIFGLVIIKGITDESLPVASSAQSVNLFTSFATTFFLAISNPLIIVWNTSVLTAKAIEYHYTKRELLVFGLSVALASLLFMGTAVALFSLIKRTVPLMLIQALTVLAGGLIISYGTVRLTKALKRSGSQETIKGKKAQAPKP